MRPGKRTNRIHKNERERKYKSGEFEEQIEIEEWKKWGEKAQQELSQHVPLTGDVFRVVVLLGNREKMKE